MKHGQAFIQIGKNGLTDGTMVVLKNAFTTREDVKVHLLKSAGHTQKNVKQISENILNELGKNFTAKIIGFTIFLKKWRKAKR